MSATCEDVGVFSMARPLEFVNRNMSFFTWSLEMVRLLGVVIGVNVLVYNGRKVFDSFLNYKLTHLLEERRIDHKHDLIIQRMEREDYRQLRG